MIIIMGLHAVLVYSMTWNLSASPGSDDLVEIIRCLYGGDLDKADIYNLGLELGIRKRRLNEKRDSHTSVSSFQNEVMSLWLDQVDNVLEKGKPTWARLAAALKSPIIGHNGLAKKIIKEHP